MGRVVSRQMIEARALVGISHTPLGLQPLPVHQEVERRVERAGLDLEQIVGLRADRLADAVAVLRSPLQGAQDEHVEGGLEELEALVVG